MKTQTFHSQICKTARNIKALVIYNFYQDIIMGAKTTKQAIKEVKGEQEVRQGGFDLFELHLPSVGYGFVFTAVSMILLCALIYYGCKRFAASRRHLLPLHQQHQLEPLYAVPQAPPLPQLQQQPQQQFPGNFRFSTLHYEDERRQRELHPGPLPLPLPDAHHDDLARASRPTQPRVTYERCQEESESDNDRKKTHRNAFVDAI